MKLLIALWFLVFASCQQSRQSEHINGGYSIREIDGCEYIEFENSFIGANNYSYSLTHKGNCKNPIHIKKPQ